MSLLGKVTAGLGVARWQRAIAMLCVVAGIAGVGGFLVGQRWERGAQAIADNKQLSDEIAAQQQRMRDLHKNAEELRAVGVGIAQDFRTAANRMDSIAEDYENERQSNRTFYAQQNDRLQQLALERPDLRDLHLGNGVLDHWNRSNAGPGGQRAAPAAAPGVGKPAPAVSKPAAGSQRQPADAGSQPRSGGRAVPRLRNGKDKAGASRGRVRAHGDGLVLQRAAATRYPERGVH